MDRKQKEALVLALAEKGKTYREITKEAGVSPNTIKAVLNRAGLDETTSVLSRTFELYSQQRIPSPLIAAIKLGLKTEEAIRYHQEYFMLLGLTEFTRAYLAVKENIWQFLDLVKLVQNARIGNNEVVELLKIANGHLPRVRLEYDRVIEEINWRKAELNSWKAAVNNEVRVYQDFCDRNLKLKRREDEKSIDELEVKMADMLTAELQKVDNSYSNLDVQQENRYNGNLNLEIKQEEVIFTNDIFIPPSNMVTDYPPNENENLYYSSQVQPSSRKLIFDTKGLFPTKAQT